MPLRTFCLCWLVLWALAVAPVQAARLLEVNVVPDGSVQPPGDRVDVQIFFFPEEGALTLELRAFAILQGAAQDAVTPVKAKDATHRDPQGNWLLTLSVEPQPDLPEVYESLVVPYASLNLPVGGHRLAYELTGRRGDEIVFVKATPMTRLNVTTGVRTEMKRERRAPALSQRAESVEGYVLQDGKPVAQEAQVLVSRAAYTTMTDTVRVQIPGEFTRVRTYKAQVPQFPPPKEDPRREAVAPLQGRPWRAAAEFEPKPKRTIYFATNRNVVDRTKMGPERFGAECGPQLTYGACLVNLPLEVHKPGEFEIRLHWWQSRDPQKYFLVEALTALAREQFASALGANDVLLFIHGYNTSFEFAVLRSAQLQHDLQFPGKSVTFSWPSAGTTAGYAHDQETNARSVDALTETLATLTAPPSATGERRKVHVIVHSMGNRLFVKAARQFELKHGAPATQKAFGHVVLAAPDVAAADFAAFVPSVVRQSESVTFYYCRNDRALMASRAVHLDKPVGLGPFFADGLDTVNADHANTSILGHVYFAAEHPLLVDLTLTMLFNRKPDQRLPPLIPQPPVYGYAHWALRGRD